jgi:hypothetical protein
MDIKCQKNGFEVGSLCVNRVCLPNSLIHNQSYIGVRKIPNETIFQVLNTHFIFVNFRVLSNCKQGFHLTNYATNILKYFPN